MEQKFKELEVIQPGSEPSQAPEAKPEARGVQNPRVVDLITEDAQSGEVLLVMLEARPWGSLPEQLRQLEAKFNSYLEYVLGGHMEKQYPQYAGRSICFRLECVENPRPADSAFFTAVANFAAGEEIRWVVAVKPDLEIESL
ncbi:MAG: DUF6572 domain-containing protein [Myxococcota bacterium]